MATRTILNGPSTANGDLDQQTLILKQITLLLANIAENTSGGEPVSLKDLDPENTWEQ